MTSTVDPQVLQDALDQIVALAGIRRVATPEGAKEFGEPIGSPIVAHPYKLHPRLPGGAAPAAAPGPSGVKGVSAVVPSAGAAPNGKQVLTSVSVGKGVWKVPAGTKLYSSVAYGPDDRIAVFPDGQVFYLSEAGHQPLDLQAAAIQAWVAAGLAKAEGEAAAVETAHVPDFKKQAPASSLKPGDKFQLHGQTEAHHTVTDVKFDGTVHAQHSQSGNTTQVSPDSQVKVPADHGVAKNLATDYQGIPLKPGDTVHDVPKGAMAETADGEPARDPVGVVHADGHAAQFSKDSSGKYVEDFVVHKNNHSYDSGEVLAAYGKPSDQPSPKVEDQPKPDGAPPSNAPAAKPAGPADSVAEHSAKVEAKDYANIADVDVGEPPLKIPSGQKSAAGVISVEPNSGGKIWLVEPKNHWAGYEWTFPKGTAEEGLTSQQTAHKELQEESGLHAQVAGFVTDASSGASTTRYYVGPRIGGKPEPGEESSTVRLVTPEEAAGLLNKKRDQDTLATLLKDPTYQKLASGPDKAESKKAAPAKAAAPKKVVHHDAGGLGALGAMQAASPETKAKLATAILDSNAKKIAEGEKSHPLGSIVTVQPNHPNHFTGTVVGHSPVGIKVEYVKDGVTKTSVFPAGHVRVDSPGSDKAAPEQAPAEPPTGPPVKLGMKINSANEADQLPTGTGISVDSLYYTKNADGSWQHALYGAVDAGGFDWGLAKVKVTKAKVSKDAAESKDGAAAPPKTGATVKSAAEMGAMLPGASVKSPIGTIYTKAVDGKWDSSNGSVNHSKDFDFTKNALTVLAPGSALKVGDKPDTPKQLDDMAIGTTFAHSPKTGEPSNYVKTDTGWKVVESDGKPGFFEVEPKHFASSIKAGELSISALPHDPKATLIAQVKAAQSDPMHNTPAVESNTLGLLMPGSKVSDGLTTWTKAPDGFWEGGNSGGIDSAALFANKHDQLHVIHEAKPQTAEAKPEQAAVLAGPHVGFGGVPASEADIKAALEILTNAKGMAIKAPLDKAGHPLAGADYHGVVAAYKQSHPDFEPKTKFAAKEAFIAALADKLDSLNAEEPSDTAVGTDNGDGTHVFGGVKVTPAQLEQAHEVLSAANGMAIKAPLAKVNNPLADSDYHGVVADHKAATAFAAKGKYAAKEAFIAALHKKLDDLGYRKGQNPPGAQEAQLIADHGGGAEKVTKSFTHGGKSYHVSAAPGSDIHYSGSEFSAFTISHDGKVAGVFSSLGSGRPEVVTSPQVVAYWQKKLDNGQLNLVSGHSVIEPHGLNPGSYKKSAGMMTFMVVNPNGTGYMADQFGPLSPDAPFHDAAWVAKQHDAGFQIYQPESANQVPSRPSAVPDAEIAKIAKVNHRTMPPGSYYSQSGLAVPKMQLHEDGSSTWYHPSGAIAGQYDQAETLLHLLGSADQLVTGEGHSIALLPHNQSAYLYGASSKIEYLKQLQMDLNDENATILYELQSGAIEALKGYDVNVSEAHFYESAPEAPGLWQNDVKVALAKMFGPPSNTVSTTDPMPPEQHLADAHDNAANVAKAPAQTHYEGIELKPGDVAYKHTDESSVFAIVHANGTASVYKNAYGYGAQPGEAAKFEKDLAPDAHTWDKPSKYDPNAKPAPAVARYGNAAAPSSGDQEVPQFPGIVLKPGDKLMGPGGKMNSEYRAVVHPDGTATVYSQAHKNSNDPWTFHNEAKPDHTWGDPDKALLAENAAGQAVPRFPGIVLQPGDKLIGPSSGVSDFRAVLHPDGSATVYSQGKGLNKTKAWTFHNEAKPDHSWGGTAGKVVLAENTAGPKPVPGVAPSDKVTEKKSSFAGGTPVDTLDQLDQAAPGTTITNTLNNLAYIKNDGNYWDPVGGGTSLASSDFYYDIGANLIAHPVPAASHSSHSQGTWAGSVSDLKDAPAGTKITDSTNGGEWVKNGEYWDGASLNVSGFQKPSIDFFKAVKNGNVKFQVPAAPQPTVAHSSAELDDAGAGAKIIDTVNSGEWIKANDGSWVGSSINVFGLKKSGSDFHLSISKGSIKIQPKGAAGAPTTKEISADPNNFVSNNELNKAPIGAKLTASLDGKLWTKDEEGDWTTPSDHTAYTTESLLDHYWNYGNLSSFSLEQSTAGADQPIKVTSVSQLEDAPVGAEAQTTFENNGGGTFTKGDDGGWVLNGDPISSGGMNFASHEFGAAISEGKMTLLPQAPPSEAPQAKPVQVTSETQLHDAPTGAKAQVNDLTSSGSSSYIKGAGGLWTSNSGTVYSPHEFTYAIDNSLMTLQPSAPPSDSFHVTEYMGEPLAPGDEVYKSEAGGWVAIKASNGVTTVFYPQPNGTLKNWKTFPAGTYKGSQKPELKVAEYGGKVAPAHTVLHTAAMPAPQVAVADQPPEGYAKPIYTTQAELAAFNHTFTYGKKTELNGLVKQLAADAGFKTSAGQYTSKMSISQTRAWIKAWMGNDFGAAYDIEKSVSPTGEIKNAHKHPGNVPGKPKILYGPAVFGETPGGVQVPDPSGTIHGSTKYNYYSLTPEAVDAYLIAAHMQNPTGLGYAQKQKWAHYHANGLKAGTDNLSLLAQSNVAANNLQSEPIYAPVPMHTAGQSVPVHLDWPAFDPGVLSNTSLSEGQLNEYLSHLFTGQPLAWTANAPLNTKQMIAQLHWLSTEANPEDASSALTKAQAAQSYTALAAHIVTQAATAAHDAPDPLADFQQSIPLADKTYQPVSAEHGDVKLDGAGLKFFVTEANSATGTKYIFKVAQSYNQNRPYIEDAAHQAAALFGYSPAQSAVATVKDQDGVPVFGQIQTIIPHVSQIEGIKPEDLTDKQLADVLREHVFDWVADNDDTHHGNLLLKHDGSVVGIDKGRAWNNFGKYQLTPSALGGHTSLSLQAHVYYEDVYKAIVSGKISPERAQAAYQAVMAKAHFIQATDDAKYQAILEYGFAHEPKVKSNLGSTHAEVIDAIVARKNNAVADLDAMWTKLFAKAGIDKPEYKAQIKPGLHTSVSPEFLADAKKGGFTGHAVVLASPDLRDSYIHAKYATRPDGSEHLVGTGRLLEGGDDKMMAWIKANANPSLFTGTQVQSHPLNPADGSIREVDAYTGINKGLRTIHRHASDGKYNEETIATGQAAYDKLKMQLAHYQNDHGTAANQWYDGDLGKAAGHAEMAQKYIAAWEKGLADKASKSPTEELTRYVYTPAPKSGAAAPPSVYKIEKLSNASMPSGKLNFIDGTMEESGSSHSVGQSGSEYKITLPSGATVHYRAHDETGTTESQKGLFRFVTHGDNNDAAFSEVVNFMRTAGMKIEDANETSLELHYWRHLAGVLAHRSDRNTGKQAYVTDAIKAAKLDSPGTFANDPAAELAAWRNAWAQYKGQDLVDNWVASKGFLPRFDHTAPTDHEAVHGKPYWMRFDYDPDEFRKSHPDPLGHSFASLHGGDLSGKKSKQTGEKISLASVKGGGRWGGMDRLTDLGFLSSGNSTESDMHHGAGNYLFTRQHTGSHYHLYIDPAVMLRTSTYAYSHDNFGDKKEKPTEAKFEIEKWEDFSASGNEVLIKNGVALLSTAMAMAFESETDRKLALAYYHDLGITQIGGKPIEEVFVTESAMSSALAKAKKTQFQDHPAGA